MPTKHRTVRLTDEDWQRIANAFAEIVPDERKPVYVRNDSNWQITEGLRMIANHEITLTLTRKESNP